MVSDRAGPPRVSGVEEWRRGYPVVMTSFLGVGIAVLASWSIGLFIEPIQEEFGWGRGEISAALLALSVVSFCAAPFVGRLIDTIGTRPVGLVGMTTYCIGLAAIGMVSAVPWQWWSVWLIIAIGYVLIKPTLWAVAISRRFDVHRGLALAVTMCGSGVILIFMPTVITRLIGDYGWRTSYLIIAASAAIVALPMIFAFLRDNGPRAPRLNVDRADDAVKRAAKTEMWGDLRSGKFVRLAFATIIMTIPTIGLQVHYVPLVTQKGVDLASAAYMAGAIGIGSIVGRITCGYLMDRWHGQIVGAVFFLLPVGSCLMLVNYTGGMVSGTAIAFVQGLALGAEIDIITYLASRYFGLRNYGTLVGTIMGGVGLANGLGPTIAGYVYDWTGSYDLFLLWSAPIYVVASLLILSLGTYSREERTLSMS